MHQNEEAASFLRNLSALGGVDTHTKLNSVLQLAIDDENELRQLFARDKDNKRLADTHVGLVNLYDTSTVNFGTTHARAVEYTQNGDVDKSSTLHFDAKFVMPLDREARRPNGSPAFVSSLEEFKSNWELFTESSLLQLGSTWSNVIAAGGSVLACLTPLPEKAKKNIRAWYHTNKYPSSDVDLFFWGLTAEQAEVKITEIYEAVQDAILCDVTCVRTKHAVSIHSRYPHRSIQIILRLYRSPAEILAGFDIDAPCCAYDGEHVWANPRSIVAMMRQCNTVDVSRRSPSYEVRLVKYASRGFEVYVPSLRREQIDPAIFDRTILRIQGLARLLVLEKITDTDKRDALLHPHRRTRDGKEYKGIKSKGNKTIGELKKNDYDVSPLLVPYGRGWNARRIENLIYRTNLGLNSASNLKNEGRRLHRHPAFVGTMEECLRDCCEHCPEPIDDHERKLQEEEDKQYIRGRISFMEENPGRQTISGSFNPIDNGEWSGQAYMESLSTEQDRQSAPISATITSEDNARWTGVLP